MGFLSNLIRKPEHPSIIELNRVLDELGEKLRNTKVPLSADTAYKELIRPDIEALVERNKEKFYKIHDADVSNIKNWVYITANNEAGDLLETGKYNMRNVSFFQGEGLMQIFETTIRGLIENGINDDNGNRADMSFADERIAELKEILAHIG